MAEVFISYASEKQKALWSILTDIPSEEANDGVGTHDSVWAAGQRESGSIRDFAGEGCIRTVFRNLRGEQAVRRQQDASHVRNPGRGQGPASAAHGLLGVGSGVRRRLPADFGTLVKLGVAGFAG